MELTSRRLAALFAFCVAAATSVARPPESPDEMAAEMERWLVEGAGARFPGGMADPARDADAIAFVDETWPIPFQERVGESIALRISPDTGCYEFADSDGTVFWTVVPVAPLTWNWISPFRSPLRPDTQNLYSPFRLAREWLLLSPSESDSRAESAEPLATRRSSLAARGAAALATNLCFTAFSYTETNLFFTAAWPTNEALPESVLDLYGSTNLSSRWTLLSSHPATTNPVSFAVVRADLPWYVEPTQHVHDASCVSLTNVVLSPLDGVTVYTNAFWSCSTNRVPGETGFFRLGTRHDTDGDGLFDAAELLVYGTSTNSVDTDGDGLPDGEEPATGADPAVADTDGDGLSDLDEVGRLSAEPYAWYDSSGATNLLAGFPSGVDDAIFTVPLFHPVAADGVVHGRIAVDANGILFLLGPDDVATNSLPDPQPLLDWEENPAHLALAAFWCDLEADGDSALLLFETNGSTVVEYRGFLVPGPSPGGLRSDPEPAGRVWLQVVLPSTVQDTLLVYYREVPEGGLSAAAVVGLQNRDRGYFTLPRSWYVLPRPDDPAPPVPASGTGLRYRLGIGTDPASADSDGDGLSDPDEVAAGTDPVLADIDRDGLSDPEELARKTNPHVFDTDGDDVGDGAEVAAGTDPLDPDDRVGYQSGMLVGNGSPGVPVEWSETFVVPRGTSTLLGLWTTSREYPEYTATGSEYDDTVSWTVVTGNSVVASGTTDVNALHGRFAAADAAGHAIGEMTGPPVDLEWKLLSAPTNSDLSVQVNFSVVNVADDIRPTTILAALYPLKVVQTNWPKSDTATDTGNRNPKRILRDGVAYVTGEPAAPALTARFQGLPDFVEVGWKLELVTERPERGTLDNRRIPATGCVVKSGDETWNIGNALDEIVGGSATLEILMEGVSIGQTTFVIRGKNPADINVEQFISNQFPADFVSYAKFIVRQESWDFRSANRFFIYNQFNNLNVGMSFWEKPNMGTDCDEHGNPISYGWGMAQITDTNWTDRTDVVWNWKTNLLAMKSIMLAKKSDYHRYIGFFRDSYGAMPTWEEPPTTHRLSKLTLSAEAWGVMTLYNGGGGLPTSSVPTHLSAFYSPWTYNPSTADWTLEQNQNNYTVNVDDKSDKLTKE